MRFRVITNNTATVTGEDDRPVTHLNVLNEQPVVKFAVGIKGIQGEPGEQGSSYNKTLADGLTATVLPTEHSLQRVNGITVLTPQKQQCEVAYQVLTDKTVYVESNISLSNYILNIY